MFPAAWKYDWLTPSKQPGRRGADRRGHPSVSPDRSAAETQLRTAGTRQRATTRQEHRQTDEAELEEEADVPVLGVVRVEAVVAVDERRLLGAESVAHDRPVEPLLDRPPPGPHARARAEERPVDRAARVRPPRPADLLPKRDHRLGVDPARSATRQRRGRRAAAAAVSACGIVIAHAATTSIASTATAAPTRATARARMRAPGRRAARGSPPTSPPLEPEATISATKASSSENERRGSPDAPRRERLTERERHSDREEHRGGVRVLLEPLEPGRILDGGGLDGRGGIDEPEDEARERDRGDRRRGSRRGAGAR